MFCPGQNFLECLQIRAGPVGVAGEFIVAVNQQESAWIVDLWDLTIIERSPLSPNNETARRLWLF